MLEASLALAGFVVLMTGTPGPANMVLMLSGAKQGFFNSLPFWIGTITGFIALNILMGLGLNLLLEQSPVLKLALKFLSAGYMLYLSFRALWQSEQRRASAARPQQAREQVFTLMSGLIVHPLNPKAWVMLSLAYTTYLSAFAHPVLVSVLCFALIGGLCNLCWVALGSALRRTLNQSPLMMRVLISLNIAVVIWALFQG